MIYVDDQSCLEMARALDHFGGRHATGFTQIPGSGVGHGAGRVVDALEADEWVVGSASMVRLPKGAPGTRPSSA
jgi:hypothetical protein